MTVELLAVPAASLVQPASTAAPACLVVHDVSEEINVGRQLRPLGAIVVFPFASSSPQQQWNTLSRSRFST